MGRDRSSPSRPLRRSQPADHQQIQVDPVRASNGPYCASIAHGSVTISLVPNLSADPMHLDGADVIVNYGVNKARFPTPVRVEASIRGGYGISEVTSTSRGTRLITRNTVGINLIDPSFMRGHSSKPGLRRMVTGGGASITFELPLSRGVQRLWA
ncbi:MaoC/PaaZ C-terminal domain-containing protein [Rhodococcus opacus]|uniref:MaoC/PaaZ C-terminal domain-containing protein n=1 Tax=Rhodococcus opacus TaxID=37919 RepID=UPI003D7B53A6